MPRSPIEQQLQNYGRALTQSASTGRLRGQAPRSSGRSSRVVLVAALLLFVASAVTIGLVSWASRDQPQSTDFAQDPGTTVSTFARPDQADFLATEDQDGNLIGYVKRADVESPPAADPTLSGESPDDRSIPVYSAADLTTIIGHQIPGVGYVPLTPP